MRKVAALVFSFGATISAWSQTITIKVNGPKTQKVVVDGKSYSVDMFNTAKPSIITIADLSTGTHNMQVVRAPKNKSNTTTSFTTRTGYETIVTIAANGSVHIKDKISDASTARIPMADAEFTALLQRTRNHLRNSSRATAASNVIANTNYYFTTTQLRMLLESFEGEVKRLELAKLMYARVTDQMNYGTLNTLFTIQQNKDALSAFIRSQGGNVITSYSESFRSPMPEMRFNTVIEDIEAQWQEGARLSSIIDVLENSSNYFTAAQAVEMIQMVADQSSRLHLAKAVFSRLTDPQNLSQLYTLFTETNYLNSFKAYIHASENTNTAGIHNYGKSAMSETDFSRLYTKSRNHFRTSSILSEVAGALTNTNNYFTSYQARQLIMLVKSETDRLQLAKSAYRGITDPNNFLSQMNDLFSWESNRNALADHVSAYVPHSKPNE